MSTAFRADYPEAMLAQAMDAFMLEYNEEPQQFRGTFNIETSTKGYEDWTEFTGLGTFALKPEGSPIGYDKGVQGTRRRTVHSTFALGVRVTMEAKEDDQFNVIMRMMGDLGAAGREHQEILAWGLFNDAFTGNTYTTADGQPLCSTAHTILKPKNPANNTTANELSPGVSLSVTGLEEMVTGLRLTKSREDRFIPLRASQLIIHPNKTHKAHQLLESTGQPFTNENQPNTVSRSRLGITPVDVPYLDSTENYWLVSGKNQHKLTWHNRKSMTMDQNTDSQTKDLMNDAHYRASVAPKEWRGVYGSQV